ncbi:MAG: hypothetical protein LBO74_10315 [Candidatus Symbiothrix sp.]|jgi:sulfatase maturation enzyme AslB (radical SAM superfamily)|nr:hypothetical protein [Candidatus Symbiothrix sp.]
MLKRGGNTFDRVLSNLDKLSTKTDINISLRMNVDDSNADIDNFADAMLKKDCIFDAQ